MRIERIRDTKRDFYRFYGMAMGLLASDGIYANARLQDIDLLVGPSTNLRQILVGYDPYGAPAGFLAYAFFCADTAECWERAGGYVLDVTEFDEGGELWITAFACKPGLASAFIRAAKAMTPGDVNQAKFIRRRLDRPNGAVRTWRRPVASIESKDSSHDRS